ncbi:MAG: hypothetical protein K5649_04495 [Lachnospiraceae bacterium]|nr:hypothetical protein [Lachnospiraceae bacterium]
MKKDFNKILRSNGITSFEQIDEDTYRISNPDTTVVNIDKLKEELMSCLLVVSDRVRTERTPQGVGLRYSKLYYVISDVSQGDKAMELCKEVKGHNQKAFVTAYNYTPAERHSISTVYRPEEGVKAV